MRWEKSYIEAVLDALRPCGAVLQIGFGNGDPSSCIQKYHPQSVTLIEGDAIKAAKARIDSQRSNKKSE